MLLFIGLPRRPKRARSHRNTVSSQREPQRTAPIQLHATLVTTASHTQDELAPAHRNTALFLTGSKRDARYDCRSSKSGRSAATVAATVDASARLLKRPYLDLWPSSNLPP
jgi:hypothetical protein